LPEEEEDADCVDIDMGIDIGIDMEGGIDIKGGIEGGIEEEVSKGEWPECAECAGDDEACVCGCVCVFRKEEEEPMRRTASAASEILFACVSCIYCLSCLSLSIPCCCCCFCSMFI
jgi:hypothetical protein